MNDALIVDTREDAVYAMMNYSCVERQQITVGDYAIRIGERILACIERKTLNDYGASIRDGRAANKMKMVDAQERSAAQGQVLHIYYVIEGDMYPKDDTQYGGVKYSSIRSSIRHLMTEYGIMIIRTRNEAETARELYELFCSYQVRPPKTTLTTTVEGRYELTDRDLLKKRVELTRQDKKIALLMSLPGIGKETAVKMSVRPLRDYMMRPEEAPNAKVRTTFAALSEPKWNHVQVMFLKGIPGLGAKTIPGIQIKNASLGALVKAIREKSDDSRYVWERTIVELIAADPQGSASP